MREHLESANLARSPLATRLILQNQFHRVFDFLDRAGSDLEQLGCLEDARSPVQLCLYCCFLVFGHSRTPDSLAAPGALRLGSSNTGVDAGNDHLALKLAEHREHPEHRSTKRPITAGESRGENQREPASQLAYLRTSSAANVGNDKDSEKRQRHAIQAFTKQAGLEIVEEFYDAAVSGADPIETRAGFAALLDRIKGNGVRTVIVEDASRFAREVMAQELGITLLISRGVRVADSRRR